jgi:hypothetical protein
VRMGKKEKIALLTKILEAVTAAIKLLKELL